MKSRNTICWLATLVVLFAAQAAWAQGPPSREEMEQRERDRMEEMSERLELTDEQEQQVQPIFEDAAEQMRTKHEELRSRGRSQSTMQAMQQAMQKIEKSTRKQLEPILSAEQLEQYDALQAEWRQERNSQRRGRPPYVKGTKTDTTP